MTPKTIIFFALLALAGAAFATDSKIAPPWTHDAGAEASARASSAATGGDAQATGGNVGAIDSSSQSFALWGSVTQVQAADCFVPAKRFGRSQSYLWGVFSHSGILERDEACWAEYTAQREHARAVELAQLELERERIALERDRLAARREAERREQLLACEVDEPAPPVCETK